MHNNNQEYGKKLVKQLQRKFVKLIMTNCMNSHYIKECKDNLIKAQKENNPLFVQVHFEELQAYGQSYAKNLIQLNELSVQLGYCDEAVYAKGEGGKELKNLKFVLN